MLNSKNFFCLCI